MRPLWLLRVVALAGILAAATAEMAWGQQAPVQGLERLTPEERALA